MLNYLNELFGELFNPFECNVCVSTSRWRRTKVTSTTLWGMIFCLAELTYLTVL